MIIKMIISLLMFIFGFILVMKACKSRKSFDDFNSLEIALMVHGALFEVVSFIMLIIFLLS